MSGAASTYQLIQLLPDARADGRTAELLDEIGADVEWKRLTYRCSPDLRDDTLGKHEIVAKLTHWFEWWNQGRTLMVTAINGQPVEPFALQPGDVLPGEGASVIQIEWTEYTEP